MVEDFYYALSIRFQNLRIAAANTKNPAREFRFACLMPTPALQASCAVCTERQNKYRKDTITIMLGIILIDCVSGKHSQHAIV